jgi:hypothetical protein
MEYNSPSVANKYSARQEIPRFLWNQKVHNCVNKSQPAVPIGSNMNTVRTLTLYFFMIYFNILLRSSYFKNFQLKPCIQLSSSPRVLHGEINTQAGGEDLNKKWDNEGS